MPGASTPRVAATVVLQKPALQQVFDNLRERGFRLIGPRVREAAVVIDEVQSITDLPVGYAVQQGPGTYRLTRTQRNEYFACTPGPPTWKHFLYPSKVDLLRAKSTDQGWVFETVADEAPNYAFIGIKSCELHAITIYDDLFLNTEFRDPHYAKRREQMFILSVNCAVSMATCFCTSVQAGPRAMSGFDLALTELPDVFVIEIGSEAGSEMLAGSGWHPASAFDLGRANQAIQRVEQQIQQKLDVNGLEQLLCENIEHPHWDDVGARCLSCGNCTLSCPTCFCTDVQDHSDLKAKNTSRTRVWDSCFSVDFSHVHGGNIRPTTRARYRQWVTHKLACSKPQVGRLACVGCGRCIAWCPVGIDITEEVRALRAQTAR